MRIATVFVGVWLLACSSSLPGLVDMPTVPDAQDEESGEADEQLRSHMNRDLELLYEACESTRSRLDDDTHDADRTDVALGAMAVGAYSAGEATSEDDNTTNQDWARQGKEMPNANQSTAQPVRRTGEERIAAMNEAIDSLSSYLIVHPNIGSWSNVEHSEYQRLRNHVREECRP